MSYNLQAIQDKLYEINNNGRKPPAGGEKKKFEDGPKLPFWKPEIGNHFIRFIPYEDKTGQPFHVVSYYTSKLLIGDGYRQVAPFQFGEEDPIQEYLGRMSQDRQPLEVFKVLSQMRPKDTFYAPVLVRGEEDKGIQVWELTANKVKDIYAILGNIDYADENLFDIETGRDFQVSITETDKMFMDNRVKDVKITERKKASPMMTKKGEAEKILATMPDFNAYFKARLRPTKAYQQMLDNAVASGGAVTANNPSSSRSDDIDFGRNDSKSAASNAAAKKNIEDAFADLDD